MFASKSIAHWGHGGTRPVLIGQKSCHASPIPSFRKSPNFPCTLHFVTLLSGSCALGEPDRLFKLRAIACKLGSCLHTATYTAHIFRKPRPRTAVSNLQSLPGMLPVAQSEKQKLSPDRQANGWETVMMPRQVKKASCQHAVVDTMLLHALKSQCRSNR